MPDVQPLRLSLWSGPRNVSTALMYSFRQRADTTVVDEPLYAHYLRASGADHPGRAEVLAAQEGDGGRVVREVLLGDYPTPVVFFKNMAHHLTGLDPAVLDALTNLLLVRDPREMLPSLAVQIADPTLRDTGLGHQLAILDALLARGHQPVVIDARALLLDPPGVLATACDRLDLAFDPAMLAWPAGPKPEDGVWARHWYGGVHASTGFAPYRPKTEPFPARLEPLLAECAPLYARLAAHALRAG